MLWFTADTHFGHSNIIQYCHRPFKSVDHMDRELIRRWNDRVKPDDTIIHLGDFCFKEKDGKNFKYYKDQLNGRLTLVRGNHDHNNGSDAVITACSINIGGEDWFLQHEPCKVAKFNMNGHIHKLWKIKKEDNAIMVNVGVDVWNYRPININEILREIYKQFKEAV